ncbi:ACP S-malonyltransferase [Paenibacillus glacialis]|uniref:[acyl-carrier-protein] S-malonyltransferase n=1 Tax=Paenibacillus glacialis TaxID=494026 RepID=A0A168MJH6_9BACL|nr:ACP S-malonyltransferase [Paenibacillus glacialis]OAB44757.1 malonyl CoA-acyl carrier protein transacylase [Paenibacillus glacialis]
MTKLAFLFPGQGSQYVGMGKALYELFPIAKETFQEANETLGFDLTHLIFEGSKEDLTLTANAQPAILTASVAAYRVMRQTFDLQPSILTGHSLGEITALTCAEAISFSDAVAIVRKRGLYMQEAAGVDAGKMAAISGVSIETIEQACRSAMINGGSVVISNYNAPDQIVISGDSVSVTEVSEFLGKNGAIVVPLRVSAPFHSPLMHPAAEKLRAELSQYTYSPLKFPVISNVTATTYTDHSEIIETLSAQMTSPVRWVESMNYLVDQGIDTVVEIGPQAVLRNLMGRIDKNVFAFAYDKQEDVEKLRTRFASKEAAVPTLSSKYTVLTRCLAIAVCTKNHNTSIDAYEKGVVVPYRSIMQLQLELESVGAQPTLAQCKEALTMLHSVFVTKLTTVDEQKERFEQVLIETSTQLLLGDFITELLQLEGIEVHG